MDGSKADRSLWGNKANMASQKKKKEGVDANF